MTSTFKANQHAKIIAIGAFLIFQLFFLVAKAQPQYTNLGGGASATVTPFTAGNEYQVTVDVRGPGNCSYQVSLTSINTYAPVNGICNSGGRLGDVQVNGFAQLHNYRRQNGMVLFTVILHGTVVDHTIFGETIKLDSVNRSLNFSLVDRLRQDQNRAQEQSYNNLAYQSISKGSNSSIYLRTIIQTKDPRDIVGARLRVSIFGNIVWVIENVMLQSDTGNKIYSLRTLNNVDHNLWQKNKYNINKRGTFDYLN